MRLSRQSGKFTEHWPATFGVADAAIVRGPTVAVGWYEVYECSSAAPKRHASVK
jgi:hypothetical protein